jgi:hypothetical protein
MAAPLWWRILNRTGGDDWPDLPRFLAGGRTVEGPSGGRDCRGCMVDRSALSTAVRIHAETYCERGREDESRRRKEIATRLPAFM